MTTYDRPFGRYYEDFNSGDVHKHWPGKTITEFDNHLFCMMTMNHHPLHTNAWFGVFPPSGGSTARGDTIYAESRVLDKVASTSKDDRGIIRVETKGFNQNGLEVCYFRRKFMVWKQSFAPPRRRPYGDDIWT